MSKVTITEAAKIANISRSTLYNKYINTGIISVEKIDDKRFIDMSEMIRVFKNVRLETQIEQNNTLNTADKDKIILLLENQLLEAKEREKWLKEQLDRYGNLLEDKNSKSRKKFFGIF